MLTNKEIKEEIILDLEKAWENPREANYWLEKLPMIEEYDEAVQDFVGLLKNDIRHEDREMFDINIDDLVEHYYINQEDYKF